MNLIKIKILPLYTNNSYKIMLISKVFLTLYSKSYIKKYQNMEESH